MQSSVKEGTSVWLGESPPRTSESASARHSGDPLSRVSFGMVRQLLGTGPAVFCTSLDVLGARSSESDDGRRYGGRDFVGI